MWLLLSLSRHLNHFLGQFLEEAHSNWALHQLAQAILKAGGKIPANAEATSIQCVCAYATSVPFIMVHRRKHDMLLSSVRVSFPSKCAAVLQALLLSSTSLAIPYKLKRLHTNMPLMMMMMMMTTTTLVWWAALDRIRSCCSIARELHF